MYYTYFIDIDFLKDQVTKIQENFTLDDIEVNEKIE